MKVNLDELMTEQRNPNTLAIDRLETLDMLRVINKEDKKVAAAVEAELPNIALAVNAITLALSKGGRLVYIGAGTSGRLGVLDASECPPTFSTDKNMVIGLIAGGDYALRNSIEGAEDLEICGKEALQEIQLRAEDVVVGLAASGRTPYVIGALAYAKSLGAITISVSCSPQSPIQKLADISITPLVGPEVISGSTRLKSGTAQKLVLNMLSTGSMIQLGKVYGNLMVDVKPTNVKLKERAKGIIAEAAGISREMAGQWLEKADGNCKLAIVMIKKQFSKEQALAALSMAKGNISKALAQETRE